MCGLLHFSPLLLLPHISILTLLVLLKSSPSMIPNIGIRILSFLLTFPSIVNFTRMGSSFVTSKYCYAVCFFAWNVFVGKVETWWNSPRCSRKIVTVWADELFSVSTTLKPEKLGFDSLIQILRLKLRYQQLEWWVDHTMFPQWPYCTNIRSAIQDISVSQ